MFQRYTEDARLVIFRARYEASAFGSGEVDTSHLLLGLLQEGHEVIAGLSRMGDAVETVRRKVVAGLPEARSRVSTSVDMPLSMGAKCVLGAASHESEQLADTQVRIIHLLLALVRQPEIAPLLQAEGIEYENVVERARNDRSPGVR